MIETFSRSFRGASSSTSALPAMALALLLQKCLLIQSLMRPGKQSTQAQVLRVTVRVTRPCIAKVQVAYILLSNTAMQKLGWVTSCNGNYCAASGLDHDLCAFDDAFERKFCGHRVHAGSTRTLNTVFAERSGEERANGYGKAISGFILTLNTVRTYCY